MRSRDFDLDFRDRARRTSQWGLGLLGVAALLWAWCAVLLLTSYEVDRKPDDKHPAQCESRLLTDRSTANQGVARGSWCQSERDWPEALAVLGLSLPVSIAGVALFTTGIVSRRMSAHSQAMRELDRLAEPADA
ncbi:MULTISPECIES: hypothetical protein [Streptomyces]|uniref:Integral membrane protein n=1 Tax=Streptomyces hydrogenans TaxID=1873719 RepID=A0ABQ3PRU4_9ACTN|nr:MULTISPECIES: hypothetical protein [Streptomyces]GHG06686.1 hypothetical protein GCM10018784_18810 [Streptomyces hydrogenans]GHI27744.1 hypothetical protein Shyd_91150 [Streptomyces hydrogenans]